MKGLGRYLDEKGVFVAFFQNSGSLNRRCAQCA
jgi:hypothetical protein